MIGSVLSHYRILEKLGEGGMGVVYKAEDTKLKRTVALKFLPPASSLDAAAKARFIHEAQAASSLQHNNICNVHDIDEGPDGQLFIVMDLYEGETLESHIAKEELRTEAAMDIAVQIARGLQKAHEKNIIHRDIKPANVMITSDGVAKILDFGLVKLTGATKLTRAGSTLGTIAYMSPEHLRGSEADHRADIFSLGCVLYEMLSGRKPFRGEHEAAMMYSIINEEPDPLTRFNTAIAPEIEQIVSKALRKDTGERYQHIDEMLSDLVREQKRLAYATGGHPPEPASGRTPPGHRHYAKTAIAIATAGVALLLVYVFSPHPSGIPANRKSIAVIPFRNFSDSKEDEYFADGITEDIITQLSKIADLKVISRTSVMRFKEGTTSVRDIGRELDVGAVLEGSVRRAGNQIRIVAQLIDADNEGHLWAETYDKELTQIFAIQSDVAQNIAGALKAKLLPAEKARIGRTQTENAEAYEYYLRGRFYWNKRTGPDVQAAIEYFQKAIARDSAFAPAYTGLATAYATLPQYGFNIGTYTPKAIAFATKGLELDSASAEAHAVLGLCKKNYEWDWAGAESELKQAILLNPGYATARHWYSLSLTAVGRFDEGMKQIEIAQELDPLSIPINANVAFALFTVRQYDRALAEMQKTLELDSNYVDSRLMLGLIYARQNRFDEAIAVLRRARTVTGRTPRGLPELGQVYARAGRRKEALEPLNALLDFSKQGYSVSWGIASIYCALRENDKAFQWVERACRDREVQIGRLKVDPAWDEIRSDPRYPEVLKTMGLEQ